MTAIVGVLNKEAVAIAADSAVTINCPSGHKVLNTANKIFQVSRKHPVGVMMYNFATFMDTPWSIVIKMYRDQLADKSFGTLQDYVCDFVLYLKSKDFFCTEKKQKQKLSMSMFAFYNEIYGQALQSLSKKRNIPLDVLQLNYNNILPPIVIHEEMEMILSDAELRYKKLKQTEEFDNYSIEEFKKYASNEIGEFRNYINGKVKDPQNFEGVFIKSYYAYLVSNEVNINNGTGLVFVGYGENEIFPSLVSIIVESGFDGHLKYTVNEATGVEENNEALIRPYAQQDVINTVLCGVDDEVRNQCDLIFGETLNAYATHVQNIIQMAGAPQEVLNEIQKIGIDTYVGFSSNKLESFIRQNYIIRLLDTVKYLGKEDLANMAESLIALTGLKRRMTSSEESVGGPVDVAVISKSDGFIWIKRKHYFDRALNEHFFTRYK